MHVRVCACMHACVCACVHVCVFSCVGASIGVCMCVCVGGGWAVDVWMCVCVCVHAHACMYVYWRDGRGGRGAEVDDNFVRVNIVCFNVHCLSLIMDCTCLSLIKRMIINVYF